MKPAALVLVLCLGLPAAVHAQELESAVVQDFEQDFEVSKWPGDKPGEVAFSKDWKADGERSLRIDPGLMSALSTLKLRDWKGYSVLRVHMQNAGEQAASVGFELQDQHTSFHERHQNGFGVPPGEQTVELDISGALWRGEENKPYRGKIKTPIDTGNITRLSFTNQGSGPVFIDKIEVVKLKKLETAGGFAFDFGKAGTQVMRDFQGVFHNTRFDAAKGFGLLADGRALGKNMSFPTPLLGDGVAWPDKGFQVDLPGGKYLGWIAYERGGFWEDEFAGYAKAELKLNGAAVSAHEFTPDGPHFFFQDVELTDMAKLAETCVWPAHAITSFTFEAAKGANVFTLHVTGLIGYPLRVAGLILAPDTDEGKAFLAAHEARQREAIATTFVAQDRGRRGEGRAAPNAALVLHALPPGAQVYPRDWPEQAPRAPLKEVLAARGQRVTVQLGVYAKSEVQVKVEAPAPGPLPAPAVSYGRYLPSRAYGVGAAWLEVNHYRPAAEFGVGPACARSLAVEYEIPADCPAGNYQAEIKLSAPNATASVSFAIRVLPVALEATPFPLGLFCNALPFGPGALDEATWWKLQENFLKEQMRAGLTALSGGPGLDWRLDASGAKPAFKGANPERYIELARKYGPVRAIVPYGGFLPGIKYGAKDPAAWAAAIQDLEARGMPPHYVYAYDEPGTPDEKNVAIGHVAPFTATGIRTIGYTSFHGADELWRKLAANTYAPAVNLHDAESLKVMKEQGQHPWVYNNGLDRYGMGLHAWRGAKLGAEGRMQWIGCFTQGFAFYNLDGREPSFGCFLVHRELGALKTPLWLGTREGLLDLRIRATLEQLAPAGDPALQAWSVEGYKKDEAAWSDEKLSAARETMLKRLAELAK
ncbi:MAG: hypothetical protein M5U26_06030 [Planctomycetota bacterium]|nr:hypothetical protein [Planctomycetota bacterium]